MLTLVLCFFLILGIYSSLKGINVLNGKTSLIFTIATVITIILNLLGAIWGITLISLYKNLSNRISQWLKRKILDENPSTERVEPLIDTKK
jgi:hypothetical protein